MPSLAHARHHANMMNHRHGIALQNIPSHKTASPDNSLLLVAEGTEKRPHLSLHSTTDVSYQPPQHINPPPLLSSKVCIQKRGAWVVTQLTFSTSQTPELAYTSLRSTSLISSRLDARMTMVLPAKEKVVGSSEVGGSLRTAPGCLVRF